MIKLKDSGVEWLGDIPAHWELIRGKNIFQQRNEKGNSQEVLLSATQKYGMYPQNLIEGVVQVSEATDLQTFKTVHKNDYVISLRSFQGGFEISDFEGVCSPAYQVFFAKSEINFLYYKFLFKSDSFIAKINSLTVGIREGKNILFKDFANVKIPLPPLAEQKKIADFLDKKCSAIDSAVDAAKKLVEKLREYKKYLITETVTKGLNPSAEMKDSGIEWLGDIPEHWKICRLKNLADIKNGQEYKNFFDENGKYPVIGSGGEFARSTNFLYDKPSVLLGRKGTIDKPLFVDFPFWTVDTMYYTEIKNTVDSKFFYYLCLQIPFDYYQYGSALPSMTQRDLNSVKFPLPPIEEQKEIVSFLDKKCAAIDENISKHQRLTEKLSEYKKSLIYEVVTGKMEV